MEKLVLFIPVTIITTETLGIHFDTSEGQKKSHRTDGGFLD
jgi:hypothetical protein